MNYSSKLLEQAVDEFASLPGIGKKTALRLVLHLLKQANTKVESFTVALSRLKNNIKYCHVCQNISDEPECSICSNQNRNNKIICVVEDIRDIMAIENTGQYNGLYHVLGGIISPMDGIGPNDLHIDSLLNRVKESSLTEIILALKGTMEGDTTAFYLFRKLQDAPVIITTIARGIGLGDELEYADELSLGRSILQRTPFDHTLKV